MYASLTGLRAAQTDLSVIANNVANVGSTGFKRSVASFTDLFARGPMEAGRTTAGIGTRLVAIAQSFGQGTIEPTGRSLDLAIAGGGFFTTRDGAGAISYTRDGAFQPDRNGVVRDGSNAVVQLLPADGGTTPADFILPTTKPGAPDIALSAVSVGADGRVVATFADGSDQVLGRIALATFPAEHALQPIGGGHWTATGDSGAPVYGTPGEGAHGMVQAGALERANVDLTEELVDLIAAQRNFQANAKAIETANAMTQTIMGIRS